MELSPSQINSLMGILNVLVRISDKEFIKNYWSRDQKSQLSCDSIIFNCREAILTLEDHHLFELLDDDYGFWTEEYSLFLGMDLLSMFKKLASMVYVFTKADKLDNHGNMLLHDRNWIEIMTLSHQISVLLQVRLNVNEEDYLM